ncbi:MAG: hypothetical protein EOP11_14880 [Proteobacteria bacterium]|nr:MAG: hypothetical protein EOP11_14880 [Pseudomonadota bacterium]
MSAAILNSYAVIPKAVLRSGLTLPCDLHIYLAANEHLLTFRRAGHTLEVGDLATLTKAAEGSILIAKPDYERWAAFLRDLNSASIAADPTSPAARAAAGESLRSLAHDPLLADAADDAERLERTKAMLDSSFEYVKEILQKCKQGPSAQAMREVLDSQVESDPLQRHCRHVSGIAALGLIALGNASIEDIADISFAGLIHDLALADLPRTLLDKHLAGVPAEALTAAEKMLLMRHPVDLFEKLKKTRTFVSDGARRIVDQHHENWSGTGFRAVKGTQIFRSARLLRIADELVSHLQSSRDPKDIAAAFTILRGMRDPLSGEHDLDPAMLSTFEQSFW